MEIITQEYLRRLVEAGSSPCVSIYMPTHRTGREVREDPIVLKDLLKKAVADLESLGIDKNAIDGLLEPARKLTQDERAWPRSQEGLAMFMCPGFSQQHKVPFDIEDVAFVGDYFYIKPLLPLLAHKPFYVLALSQGAVRLLEGNAYGWRLVPLPTDVATSMDKAILPGETHQTTTVKKGGNATNPFSSGGAAHGQAQDLQQKLHEDLMFFLRQVDDGVRRVLADSDAPVVLAGAESITPHFRKASEIKNIYDEEVRGNAEHVSNERLADAAREALAPFWHAELNAEQERYGDGTSQHLSSHDAGEIVEAARNGRVHTLFVPVGAKDYTRDPGEMSVTRTPDRSSMDNDLLNRAAVFTLLSNGRILPVLREEMPGGRELAAIFRYPQTQAIAS